MANNFLFQIVVMYNKDIFKSLNLTVFVTFFSIANRILAISDIYSQLISICGIETTWSESIEQYQQRWTTIKTNFFFWFVCFHGLLDKWFLNFKVIKIYCVNKLLNLKLSSFTSNHDRPAWQTFRQHSCHLIGSNKKNYRSRFTLTAFQFPSSKKNEPIILSTEKLYQKHSIIKTNWRKFYVYC